MKAVAAALAIVALMAVGSAGCGRDAGGTAATASSALTTTSSNGGQSQADWLEIVFEPDATGGPVTNAAMDQAVTIIQERVDMMGVSDARVQRQGDRRISVRLSGVEDVNQALQIIGKTAMLEFYDVAQFGDAFATPEEALSGAGVDSEAALPAGYSLVFWPRVENGTADQYYLVTTPAPVTGAMLQNAQVGFDEAGRPMVDMEFNTEGAAAFAEVTGQLAQVGLVTGVRQRLAIVLDGVVHSAPTVMEEITGGGAEITGQFTQEEANSLALVLQSGALPFDLVPVSQGWIVASR